MEINASQFVRNFGQYQDQAIREPVIVTSHNRVVGVFLSPDDYTSLRRASLKSYHGANIPDELVKAIEDTSYPSDEEFAAVGL